MGPGSGVVVGVGVGAAVGVKSHGRAPKAGKGLVRTVDGVVSNSPSVAAIKVSGMASVPGWNVWRVPSRGNRYLAEIRDDFYQAQASSEAVEGSGGDAS